MRIALITVLVASALPACSVSPAQQEAIQRAWAERDAERAQECLRRGLRIVAGNCTGNGGP